MFAPNEENSESGPLLQFPGVSRSACRALPRRGCCGTDNCMPVGQFGRCAGYGPSAPVTDDEIAADGNSWLRPGFDSTEVSIPQRRGARLSPQPSPISPTSGTWEGAVGECVDVVYEVAQRKNWRFGRWVFMGVGFWGLGAGCYAPYASACGSYGRSYGPRGQ